MPNLVSHPLHGIGEIVGRRCNGFEIKIRFNHGVTRWVKFNEIIQLKNQDRQSQLPSSPSPELQVCESWQIESKPVDCHQFKARRIIEAFRHGLMPHDCVTDFTYGRDLQLRQIRDWLDNPAQGTNLLIGSYGSGKTHLLHYLHHHLIEQDFAVAHVEVDVDSSPFSRPKKVYHQVVKSLAFKKGGETRDFQWLVREGIRRRLINDHRYFCYLDNNDPVVWNWIEGGESSTKPWENEMNRISKNIYSYLPSLYDYGTAANIYCYLLSSLGWLVTQKPFQTKRTCYSI